MPAPTRFGAFIRQRRKTLGLTLREFCRRNGFDPGNLSRLERGLTGPPVSTSVLKSYAKALKLDPDAPEWDTLFDLAAAETGRIPPKMADDQIAREKLPERFRTWRDQRTRSGPWTRATDLELWANYLDARSQLPQLVRRLVYAAVDSAERIDFPAGEGVQKHGYDGIVLADQGNEFVPGGLSVWEMGVDSDPRKKAEDELKKRTKNPCGVDPSKAVFVFVTPRKWKEERVKNKYETNHEWCKKKRDLGVWKDVRVIDSSQLEQWLETAPAVDAWMARHLGRRHDGVMDIDEHWKNLYALTDPGLTPQVYLTSRDTEIKTLEDWLLGPPSSLAFQAPSPAEVLDFLAAYIASRDGAERERIESRVLVVDSKNAWHVLTAAKNRLLLVPRPSLAVDAETVAEAVRQGHHVLLGSNRFGTERNGKHNLSRLNRYDLEKALVSSGVGEEQASRFARDSSGSLTVLKRRMSQFAGTKQPKWSQQENAGELAPILLAGGWDDASSGDRTILEKLADRPYDDVLSIANRWAGSEDPPVMRLLTRWSLVSREDSWLLLAPNVTRPHLERFVEVAVEVLGEDNPKYDLPADERWRASLHGTLPKYSDQLRTGIAETLALLRAKSDSATMQDSVEPAARAERAVQQLLTENATWKRWASLSRQLPTLAEAAPNAFLNAVEKDLRQDEPVLIRLFADDGDPLLSSCNHAGLLWALETLAWDASENLTRASLALARLAQLAPKTRWLNSPLNSLIEVFKPWHPQTSATVEQRIQVLNSVTRKLPDVGWKWLLSLLPTLHGVADYTHRPAFRDWSVNRSHGVTNVEYWQQVNACANRLVELVGTNAHRWIHVIQKLDNFPAEARNRLISQMKTIDLQHIDSETRRELTDELRDKIRMHGDHPYTDWALPSETLSELKSVLQQFEPQDSIEKHLWLFVAYPRLPDESRTDSWRDRDAKVFELRRNVLSNLLTADGISKVFELAETAESPTSVGFVVGKTGLIDDGKILPQFLGADKQKLAEFAIGFARGRFVEAGWKWLDGIALDGWTAEQSGHLLALVPDFDRRTWETVSGLGNSVSKHYWSCVRGFCRDGRKEDVEFAVSLLLQHDRPLQAVDVLGMAIHDKCAVDASLVMETLEAPLRPKDENVQRELSRNDVRYDVNRLFEQLESDPDVDAQRLAGLEFAYLGILENPETLHRPLATKPTFFAELLSLMFRSDKEPKNFRREPTNEEKARAENAYRLLAEWTTVPGLNQDGAVDEQTLLDWVTTARSICKETGHLGVCDGQIGEVLAHAPHEPEPDGSWPCIPVRDVIEEVDSEDLVRGFEIGIFNKRGAYSKSFTEGGKQEWEKAEEHARYAKACEIEWPTTAAALRCVAASYEADAKREDERVKERSLK